MARCYPIPLNCDEDLRGLVFTVSKQEAEDYENLLKEHGMKHTWEPFELTLPTIASERLHLMQRISAPASGLVTRLPLGNRDMVGDDEAIIYKLTQNPEGTIVASQYWGQYYPLFGTVILCDVTPEGEWY
tara:strand:+ start:5039 stop:5428 length:390 start_codon:yes stop_codon:yes gene_type:complete